MKQPYNTALYMRLSRDDENYGDSVSIETQRTILQQYAKDNELHVVGEYIDDGWSGTTFERPNFKRMMADVDAGRVNCIVTKDLSRFGRDHIMVGYYLEYEPQGQDRTSCQVCRRRTYLCLCASWVYPTSRSQKRHCD